MILLVGEHAGRRPDSIEMLLGGVGASYAISPLGGPTGCLRARYADRVRVVVDCTLAHQPACGRSRRMTGEPDADILAFEYVRIQKLRVPQPQFCRIMVADRTKARLE